jgi:hypothetical protein
MTLVREAEEINSRRIVMTIRNTNATSAIRCLDAAEIDAVSGGILLPILIAVAIVLAAQCASPDQSNSQHEPGRQRPAAEAANMTRDYKRHSTTLVLSNIPQAIDLLTTQFSTRAYHSWLSGRRSLGRAYGSGRTWTFICPQPVHRIRMAIASSGVVIGTLVSVEKTSGSPMRSRPQAQRIHNRCPSPATWASETRFQASSWVSCDRSWRRPAAHTCQRPILESAATARDRCCGSRVSLLRWRTASQSFRAKRCSLTRAGHS